jgi:hypothetical protein
VSKRLEKCLYFRIPFYTLGKGFSGTFALVDGSRKTGAKYEDAIESAVIAMNEPKDASVTAIRDYLGRCVVRLITLCYLFNLNVLKGGKAKRHYRYRYR